MQKTNWGKPLALAAILVVLGSTAYWLEFSHKPKQEETQREEKKFFRLKDAQIATISLVEGAKTTTFRCLDLANKLCKPGDNAKWEITSPAKLKADDSNVNSLVSTINNLTSNETIDLTGDPADKRERLLKEYGLDPATRLGDKARRIEVTDDKGAQQILFFGEPHPVGDNIFTLFTASPQKEKSGSDLEVRLAPSFAKTSFDKDLTHWRNKKLVTAETSQIQKFKLKGSHVPIEGERKDGQWILRTPKDGEVPGDIENVDGLLSAATYLTAKEFSAEDKNSAAAKKTLSSSHPALTLTLDGFPGAPVTLTLYQKAPGKKLKNPTEAEPVLATASNLDPLYQLEPGAVNRLDKSPQDLRLMKLITSMDRFSAKRLAFESPSLGAAPLILVQSDSKWVLETDKKEAKADKVNDLLDKLSGNRIKEFLTGSAIPAGEKSGITVTLGDDKTEKRRQVVFWKAGQKIYARDLLSNRKEAFLVDPVIFDALPNNPGFFNAAPAPQSGATPQPTQTGTSK